MYTMDGRIRYSECDENGTLSLLAMLNYLQDSSIFHAEDLFHGVSDISGRGLAWLIAAWQIRIERLPRFCDRISVSTWVHSMSKTLSSRNFVMADENGTPLVQADSLWFVFDAALGRPVRIPDDQRIYLTGDKPLDLPPTQRRLSVTGAFDPAPEVTVGKLHLDTNNHVNNAQYLGMATDAIAACLGDQDARRAEDIESIFIQYKQQARLGDVISPLVQIQGHIRTVDLQSPDGDSYAIVRIGLRGEQDRVPVERS